LEGTFWQDVTSTKIEKTKTIEKITGRVAYLKMVNYSVVTTSLEQMSLSVDLILVN
jgi:hypothetical protein